MARPAAELAAETALAVFRLAYDRWLADPAQEFAPVVRTTRDDLRALFLPG